MPWGLFWIVINTRLTCFNCQKYQKRSYFTGVRNIPPTLECEVTNFNLSSAGSVISEGNGHCWNLLRTRDSLVKHQHQQFAAAWAGSGSSSSLCSRLYQRLILVFLTGGFKKSHASTWKCPSAGQETWKLIQVSLYSVLDPCMFPVLKVQCFKFGLIYDLYIGKSSTYCK